MWCHHGVVELWWRTLNAESINVVRWAVWRDLVNTDLQCFELALRKSFWHAHDWSGHGDGSKDGYKERTCLEKAMLMKEV
jgi:hypothetical protein